MQTQFHIKLSTVRNCGAECWRYFEKTSHADLRSWGGLCHEEQALQGILVCGNHEACFAFSLRDLVGGAL